ncbi:MAG: hypothetical protein IPK15_23060 [Verrucomicrobia bacterium]|nr:hypothetical protein [Verrucomicrobiota bacterium]
MKNLLITAGAVALAAVINLNAAEPLLSPKAKANQTRTVSGTTENRLERGLQPMSPKAQSILVRKVSGTGDGRDLVRESRNITASPKVLAVFPHLAKSSTSDAMASCKTMKKGECAMACCKETTSHCAGGCCKS